MNELHVVALSGGKDSTAMALKLAELEPRNYVYVLTPTGNELPEMFEHWKKLGELLGKPLTPVVGGTLEGLIEKWNALPNWRQRWCTRALKIDPYAGWLMKMSEMHDRIVSYVGLRADEEAREGGDYAAVPGVEMDFPLRRWGMGLADVVGYLKDRDVKIPWRTDCALCFFQTLPEWFWLYTNYRSEYDKGIELERKTGYTFRSPGRDTWPASLEELAKAFEGGRRPRGMDQFMDKIKSSQCRVCRM